MYRCSGENELEKTECKIIKRRIPRDNEICLPTFNKSK